MLIESFSLLRKEHPDFYLTIYGEGPLREGLEAQVRKLDLSSYVALPGFIDNLHEQLEQSYAFVLTSNYEGIPNALLEALALGLPVISTDCPIGGARMFIKPFVNGILVPVGDVYQLYSAMRWMAANPTEREGMGNRACQIRYDLDLKSICRQWITYIDTVTSGRKCHDSTL